MDDIIAFFFNKKWPNGFSCPSCGCGEYLYDSHSASASVSMPVLQASDDSDMRNDDGEKQNSP